MLDIQIATTDEQMALVYDIRKTVFVNEQHVPLEIEIDEHEYESIHFLGLLNGQSIGASRLRFLGSYGKLERICILKKYRGRSFGKQLIKRMEEEILKHGINNAKLHAQTHAESFYEQLGYKTDSEPFIDADILHVSMVKKLH